MTATTKRPALSPPPRLRPPHAWLRQHAARLHRVWPGRIERPVFVVGCARSGTTIFGQLLGQAPHIHYLNEPRHIWCTVNPALDVWAFQHPIHRGQLCWGAADAQARDRRRLSQWFHLELTAGRRSRLVEKNPENVFRLGWLAALFPTAKFIHLVRDGRAVAASLAAALARWFPRGYWESSRHYGIFRDYAARAPELWERLSHIRESDDNYARCLFVWVCALREGRLAGPPLGADRYLEVRYEALLSQPEQELRRLFDWMGEDTPASLLATARQVLRPQGGHGQAAADPGQVNAIAGDWLADLGY